ncbi:MAG: ABC transporter substrate-binding protein [Eubacteriales bacterium]|nr:ABC transporter substrate-binding protein [Eubacteriales bacterium]
MNWKRGIAAVLCGAVLLGILAGCGASDADGGSGAIIGSGQAVTQAADVKAVDSFTLAYNETDGLDPLACTTPENQLIVQLCFERLFVLDNEFQPQKELCDTIEQTGDRSYTLTIRPGVKFHSGQEVTAEDVVYSLNNARLREDSIYKEQLAGISSVKYSGDEIKLRLYRRNANIAALLDVPIFRQGTEEDTCPDGSGPYQLVTTEAEPNLIPFEQWSGGKVGFCKSITLRTVADSVGAANLLSSGELSLLLQRDAEEEAVQGAKYTASIPTTTLHYLGVNCDREPLDDEEVRTALSMLLDRSSIVQTCFAGRADAAAVPISPVPEGTEVPSFDTKAALDLLEKAGIYDRDGDGYLDVKRGEPFQLEIIYNEIYSTKGAVLQQYAKTLNEAGIATTVKPLSFADCQKALRQEAFQLYYGEYAMDADFNLSSLIGDEGERNFSGYYSGEMEQAMQDMASASVEEQQEARKAYIECFTEQTPIIPIAFERAQIASADVLPEQFDPWPDDIFHGIETWSAS